MTSRERALKLGAFALVVVAVVGVTALASTAFHAAVLDDADPPEFDTGEVYLEKIEAEGTVEVDGGADSVVVFDRAHRNGFEREDVRPLTAGIADTGSEVRFHHRGQDLEDVLADADAFVVVDPRVSYTTEEVDTVEEFVDDGGRLLVVAEPNRAELQPVGPLTFEMRTVRSETTALTTRFGFDVSTGHLYNMAEHDGNHRNVLVEPPEGSPLADDVDRAAVYTAASVETAGGEEWLVAAPGTERSPDRGGGEYAVAARDDTVLVVGDASFMAGERYNVADNERVVAAIVEFLVRGG